MRNHPAVLRAANARRLAILVATLFCVAAHPVRAADEGQPAPAFSAKSIDGNGTVALGNYKGKVVYLDFWASWCAPCQTSLPAIEALRKEFPADQFQVIAINVDQDPEKARKVIEKLKLGYPSATDPEGRLPATFGIKTMPTSYLIDRDGVIRRVHPGFRSGDVDAIRKQIQTLVEAKK